MDAKSESPLTWLIMPAPPHKKNNRKRKFYFWGALPSHWYHVSQYLTSLPSWSLLLTKGRDLKETPTEISFSMASAPLPQLSWRHPPLLPFFLLNRSHEHYFFNTLGPLIFFSPAYPSDLFWLPSLTPDSILPKTSTPLYLSLAKYYFWMNPSIGFLHENTYNFIMINSWSSSQKSP